MQIEQNEKGVEKILNRSDRGRVLSLFSVIDKLDSSDIIKITGLFKVRVSEIMKDLEGISYLQVLKAANYTSKGNTHNYYILYPPNIVITKLKMQRFISTEQFNEDKAKIEELLEKGLLTGVKK